jgi:hypothetical protein
VKRSKDFDERIARWQKRHDIDPNVAAEDSEVSKETSERHKKAPEAKLGQAEAQLRGSDESHVNARHGTKRRRYDDDGVTADTDLSRTPRSKRQKARPRHTSPVSGGVETEEPAETSELNRSASSIVDNDSRESQERGPSHSVAGTDGQNSVPCEAGEDKKFDERSLPS